MSLTAITLKFKMCLLLDEACSWAENELSTDINLPPLMPDKDNNFRGSLVLDFRKRWRHVQSKNSFWPAYSQLGMLGACSCTRCNSNWANKIHQIPLEWWIQKSLQWTAIGRTHVQHDQTLVMTKSKCCFFCIHKKNISHERDHASCSDLFQFT